jgi:sulfide dehydrogenase cytochrome subunit
MVLGRMHRSLVYGIKRGSTMRIVTGVLLIVVLWLPDMGAAETVPARGAALAYTCVTCHGPDGHSQGAIPSLTTLSSADIMTALQAFRTETRPSTVMHRITRGLDNADITAVATYFATLPRR